MANQSVGDCSYLVHGHRMLSMGATVHWTGPPTYDLDRDTRGTACYALGW
jgi:hypothetical protein